MRITLISKTALLREYLPVFFSQSSLISAKLYIKEILVLKWHSTSHAMPLVT